MVDRVKVLLFGIYLIWTVFATLGMRQGEHSRCLIMIVFNGLFVCKQGMFMTNYCVLRGILTIYYASFVYTHTIWP